MTYARQVYAATGAIRPYSQQTQQQIQQTQQLTENQHADGTADAAGVEMINAQNQAAADGRTASHYRMFFLGAGSFNAQAGRL